jgi:hypothetical protein
MVLDCLANILKICGIDKMKNNTTLTATMAGRRHGKSMFGKNVTAVWVDEAEKLFETPKEYLEFNTPPLALVLAMQEEGKDGLEIYSTVEGVGKHTRPYAGNVVTAEHQQRAADIYDYFAKKHTMRRIKDEFVSKFMLAVDDLCENRKKIDKEHVKVLVSLPRIYKQNRALERVMKGRKSAKKMDLLPFAAWRGEVEFVERVHVKMGRTNEYQYYFSTPNNHLIRIVVKKGEYGSNAWDALVKFPKLHIDTEAVFTFPVRGYDFNVLQPSPAQLTVTPVI